jgi:hypothetical protein
MERLIYIQNTNPEWANIIQCFMIDYPEFMNMFERIPLSPIQQIPYNNVNTLFYIIIYNVISSSNL